MASMASIVSSRPIFNRSLVNKQKTNKFVVRAEERPLWFPGETAPAHLDGSLPADYGFDPLSLGSDPDMLMWMRQAELIHCRWAMMGAAGIIIPAFLTKLGVMNVPVWFEAGKVANDNSDIPFVALLMVELIAMGFVESKRWLDIKNPGSQGDGSIFGITDDFKGKSVGYPGGMFFDPMGFSRGSEKAYRKLQVKEIANGRLAMVAMVGFWAQYAATGKGPIDNLFEHIADPGHVTFSTNGISLPFLG
eukprot:TRINITY_DN656_c0_g1_i16.p1 TRINITY_DN656_c0_g1~~TRINITY_DN656_c0_g1_i16.p1  ORF type:complete len:248 (+),score=41.24 TRINITY_DN656_c0_g1_i16:115-858(+)